MSCPDRHPVLLLVSAPSGAGKTTLCRRLLESHPELVFSVSATTRSPRAGERDGVDYHFLCREDFERGVGAGEFLEHAEVHGNLYGTPVKPLRLALDAGRSVLLDVDVQGGALIRSALARKGMEALREAFVDVFIEPPSREELRARLLGRGTDLPEVVERRLRNAEREILQAGCYAFRIVNRELDAATADLLAVYRAAGLRTRSHMSIPTA